MTEAGASSDTLQHSKRKENPKPRTYFYMDGAVAENKGWILHGPYSVVVQDIPDNSAFTNRGGPE